VPPAEGGGARLVLYSRRYCHLCDEMLTALKALDSDPALEARFGEDVPVLMLGEVELSRHRLDADRVRAYLGQTG
jgi:glutaredoxin-like protein DUF836